LLPVKTVVIEWSASSLRKTPLIDPVNPVNPVNPVKKLLSTRSVRCAGATDEDAGQRGVQTRRLDRTFAGHIDGLAFVSVPCEIFCHFGLQLKRRSPFPATAVFGVTNGEGAERVRFCADCHNVVGAKQDHRFFVPEKYRTKFLDVAPKSE